ncbi:MAG: sulfite exporter TauE/SafE family protein [Pseudomonadota bacterium]
MDWLYVLMPISGVIIFWPGLVILGIGVGIIGGFFGMGGAWMVTPGLNILGFPMAFAIGTDIAHMAGKSLISTMRHGRFGNVDYRLGFIMLVGTIVGFEVGAQMIMWLERLGKVELYVRWMYVVLLVLIAWMIFSDVAKQKRNERKAKEAGMDMDNLATGIEWHKTLHKIKIPPVIHFKTAGFSCSAWLPIFISLFTGWLAGILGIGGGLIRMPALIYFIGCPTHIAVGTDLFEVMISGLYGAATYTFKGRTELLAALIMLVGAAVGAQVGTVATKYIKGYGIRIAFGVAVIGCCISIIMKLIPRYIPWTKVALDISSTVLILGLVGALSVYIFIKMIQGAREEIAVKKGKS